MKHGEKFALAMAIAGGMMLLLLTGMVVRGPAVHGAAPAGLALRTEFGKVAWNALADRVCKIKTGARDFCSRLMKSGTPTVEVDGRVLRPGPMPHREGMTTRDALLAAGGADRFGQIRRVHLFRNGQQVARLDLKKTSDLLVRMEPGDRLRLDAKVPWEN